MKKVIFVVIFSVACSFGAKSFADTPNLSDTESPRIDFVSLSNRNIEVSKSASELLITVTASDNLNAISQVFLAIYRSASPYPTQVPYFGTINSTQPVSTKILNGRIVSEFQFKLSIPKGLASGDYYIWTFAKDAAGNYPQSGSCDKYCNSPEMAKLPESTFSIKNDSTGQIIEVAEFDIAGQFKTLQSKYDSLVLTSRTLTSNYDSLLLAKIKLESDLKSSQSAASESELKYKAAEEAKQIAQNDAFNLHNLTGTLKTDVSSLQAQLAVANKKLAVICKAKPKPKGC